MGHRRPDGRQDASDFGSALKNAFRAFSNVACERRDFRSAPEITRLRKRMTSSGRPWPGRRLLKSGHSTAC